MLAAGQGKSWWIIAHWEIISCTSKDISVLGPRTGIPSRLKQALSNSQYFEGDVGKILSRFFVNTNCTFYTSVEFIIKQYFKSGKPICKKWTEKNELVGDYTSMVKPGHFFEILQCDIRPGHPLWSLALSAIFWTIFKPRLTSKTNTAGSNMTSWYRSRSRCCL